GPGGLPSFERFVKYIITDTKQPGVADFDAFEARWTKWLKDLDYFHGGPPQAARDFVLRAREYVAQKHVEDAEDDYRCALQKTPDHLDALMGLGDLLATTGHKDEAIACYRRAAESVRRDMCAAGFPPTAKDEANVAIAGAIAHVAKLDPE